jgi:Zn-dependent metalloprotease/plastocyanin
MKKLILNFYLLFLFLSVNAQVYLNTDADKIMKGSKLVAIDENTGTIKHFSFPTTGTGQQFSKDGKEFLKNKLSLPNDFDLNEINSTNDKFGKHVKYQFTYKKIPIAGYVFGIQMDENKVLSANGYYKIPKEKANKDQALISEEKALSKALDYVNAKIYLWETDVNQNKPESKLFYIEKEGELVLVYQFDIYSEEPLSRQYVYVNAETGEVEKTTERIHIYTNATGTAVTKYQGTKTIKTDLNGGTYRLRENSRGSGIETYDLNNSTSYSSAVDFTDADNYWNTTANQDNAAYDAHFGSEATYDYYFNKFGRNSIDGAGFALKSYIHYSSGYVNAFWDGNRMTYGDGDGSSYTALTSIDIVAHEITHGLTEHTSNLNYSYESGALNESFSDIFGTAIDFYANPTTANYLMGDQISVSGTPFRSMINPNMYDQPDTYHGAYWYTGSDDNGGVHYNSGVQNYWFYLLCVGGNGTNDIGNTFSVSPIGMDKAAAIAYKTLTVYLTPSSQYADARYFSIQSAIDLYGECSPEVINVTNAWYAVGVGAAYSNAVVANYMVSQNYFCTYPATVQFTNSSVNASTYIWNFGDGTSSTLPNPIHTYNTIGNYTVTLISTGVSECSTTDTLVSPNPIIVTNSGGPVSATCTPTTVNATGIYGIINFTLNGINNNTSGSSDSYKDYTCNFSSTLTEGLTYNYSITTGTSNLSMVKMWIDLNNDGQFNNTNELLVNASNITKTKAGIINIPHPIIYNTPLRLRIASDMNSGTYLANACTNSQYGQYEDYSVIIHQNSLPPVAKFTASSTSVKPGQTVSFTDSSLNLPTSWIWTFPGGTPSTSTEQNPVITYNTLGTYPVKLKVQNSYGHDSIEKISYIKVVNTYNMCSTTSTVSNEGILYDSGGPAGNYQNYENCSFLIEPGCATSITLTFSAFNTESGFDYLTVYNGSNSSGTQLLQANGSKLPNSVTATSGKMFITFKTDRNVTYSGFQANWTSVVPSSNPPVVDFTVSNDNPPLNTVVQFTDLSANSPNAWIWNFGDGSTSTLKNPTHTFNTSGSKIISVTASNCFGSQNHTDTIIVQDAPVINVNPATLSAVIGSCVDSISSTLVIKNNGRGTLSWNWPGANISVTDDFDPGVDNSVWQAITGGVATNSCGSFSAPNALYFDGSNNRQATTNPINTVSGGTINFYLEISNGTAPCERADSGEDVVLSYSANGGITWINIKTYFTGSYNSFTPISEIIPVGAKTNATLFKWSQPSHSGSGCDNWSIDDVSISFTSSDFSHLSVKSGSIAPGDSSIVNVSFIATGLNNDVYFDTIDIFSNDPLIPLRRVSCSLTVDGAPQMALSDTSIRFNDLFRGLSKTDTLRIINKGCDELLINNITISNNDFTLDKTAIEVAHGDTALLRVTFSPSSVGVIDGFLTIYSNDADTSIYLTGTGLEPPVITFSPERLSTVTNSCDDSITHHIVVSNLGGNDLSFNIEGNREKTVEMLALTYGVDYTGEYKNTIKAINQYFTNYRLTEINTTVATALETALIGKDVLLIAKQESGLSSAFTGFAPVIQAFISNGGKVIFCGTSNSSCIFNTGIFSGYYGGNNYSSTIGVVNSNHSVTKGLPASFTAPDATYLYNFSNTDTTRLVSYNNSYDVVTCREVGKGKAIYIGFDYYSYNNEAALLIANAVRWGIQTNSFPEWVGLKALTDTVSSGDSTVIDVTFYPSALINGVYSDSISIYSNDPIKPLQKVACTLTIDGTPEMALSDTSVLFSDLFIGLSIRDTLMVINNGCDALLINDITTSNSDFSLSKTAIEVAPGDTAMVQITFSPSSVGVIDGILTIYSNDEDTSIYLTGIGLEPPIITFSPERLSTITNSCDDSITHHIVVSNQGESDLTFHIEGNREETIEMLALTYGVDYEGEYKNTLAAINQYFTNYRLTEINTTVASSLETALRGKDVLLIAKQESGSSSVFTGFAPVIQSFVSNGGKVIFCGTYNSSCIFNTGIFSGYYGGSIYSSIINIVNTSHSVTEGVSVSFNAADATYLYNFSNADTTRLVRYNNSYDVVTCRQIGKGKAVYIGFDYYSYNNEAARIIANAVKWGIQTNSFPEWVGLSALTDTVSSGDSTAIDVTFYPSALINGVYSDSISIYSNDPIKPLQRVGCTLTVDGTPTIAFSDTCVIFEDLFKGLTVTDTFVIFNSGCDELLINKITSSHSDFAVKKSAMNIAPGDSEMVPITFSPSSVGDISGFLTLYSNSSDTILNLQGIGLEPPVLNVVTTSLNAKLNTCNDSLTSQLIVSNQGGSPLVIHIEGNREKTVEMLALTYGVDYAREYTNTLAAINQYFTNYRLTEINTTIASALETALQGKDVLLIAKQESGSSSVFTGFAPVIQSFVNNGGKVIFCGTYYSSCIFNTGIFSGYSAGSISSGTINVVNTSHSVTEGLSVSLPAPEATYLCGFNDLDLNRLVRLGDDFDVVSCREIGKGKAIYIGFDYYSYNNEAARIIANAVRWGIQTNLFPDWININNSSDTLSINDTSYFDVTFKTDGLNNGLYSDSIIIYSNDPITPVKKISCELTIIGSPEIALSDTTLNFGNVVVGRNKNVNINIFNNGCNTLMINDISTSLNDFQVNKRTFSVAPGDSEKVNISFIPGSLGSRNGTLTIFSNDVNKVLCLSGNGLDSPVMELSDDTVKIEAMMGSANFVVLTTSTSWSVESNQTWLDVTPENGNGSRLIIFTAEANLSAVARIALITIRAANGETLNVTVIQEGVNSSVRVKKATEAISIDGIEEAIWNEIPPVPISKNFQNETPTVTAYWKAMWTDSGINVLMNVHDNDHWPAWEPGGSAWAFDWTQVLFDVNETLVDGKGPAANSTGHYQSSPGFTQFGYDIPVIGSPADGRTPGGDYAYHLSGENYVYEQFFPFENFVTIDNVTMDKDAFISRPIGFDVTITDQDQGITTSRQRAVWMQDGKDNVLDESWNNMDDAGTIRLVEEITINKELKNVILSGGESECFNAVNTITVAGGGSTVEFLSGSSVNLIAGSSVILLPGFHAYEGSYTHAYITTNGLFCDGAPGTPVVSQPVEKSVEEEIPSEKQGLTPLGKAIKVYPNPNNGQFTLELTNIESGAVVCIYNMLGARVYQSSATNEGNHRINLSGIRRGIYFVKVQEGKEQFTRKMVVD